MIKLTQLKGSEELLSLNDYYTLVLKHEPSDADKPQAAAYEIGMLQVSDGEVIQRASVQINDTESGFSEEEIAPSLARLLLGSVIVAEPSVLVFLRDLFNRQGQDGEIHFVPLSKLAAALYPELSQYSLPKLAEYFSLSIPEAEAGVLQDALLTDAVFRQCQSSLSGAAPVSSDSSVKKAAHRKRKASSSRSRKSRVSDKQLHQWADKIWTISPWAVLAAIGIVILLVIILIPKDEEVSVDREKAPNSYLVLSWNDTGKYGTQPKDKDAPIEFRIPYGVYNVLNNNSIPVELSIVNEDEPSASAKTLSASDSDEDEGPKNSTVIIRPSMSREVILDVGQYLTISEDAKELIFFYVSEVPEELPSDTTGHAGASQAVVYAYVNGTEVRFRSAPSLEGHIIDTMKNGQQVQVLGITGEWTHVSVQDHKGYIFSQFLSSEDPTPPG